MNGQGNAGPLAGLSVLDLSTTPAGAIATLLLADQGATVLVVEPSGGSPLRAMPVSRVWLRGKRSVLALDGAAGQRLVDQLIVNADVVVTGDPQNADGYVLPSPEQRPDLVVCNTGGSIADVSADDDLVAAGTGIMGRQPGFRDGPVYIVLPLSTYACGMIAAQAIGAALYERERSGLGDWIEVPLLSGSLAHQSAQLAVTEYQSPLMVLRRNAYGQLPLYRLYQCQDGRWLHLGLINARFWPRLCVAIERADLISDPRFDTPVRFTSHESRRALMDILADTFITRPFAEWDRIFDEADVPCAPACTADEFAMDEHVLLRHGVVQVEDQEVGDSRQPGLALQFLDGPLAPAGSAPRLGEHDANPWGDQVEERSGSPAASIGPVGKATVAMSARKGPLAGVRILDLSGYIAGPLGPAMLADLGADVIKIEGPDGDGLRGAHAGFIAWNRGKRSIGIDLRSEAGQELLHRLCETADVVVDNMRPGVAERLGAGYATLSRINPRLIYCYVSAYGSTGPYRHKPGVDPLMQARSGIERGQGGHEHPPVFLLIAVTDNTCAMLNAAGITMALYHREKTGKGLYFETSLLQAAALVQSDALLQFEGRPAPRVNDLDHTGPGPLRRLYQCADGWIFLAAEPVFESSGLDYWPSLCAALERPDLAADARFATAGSRRQNLRALEDELLVAFAQLPADECLARLDALGVPAVRAFDTYVDRFVEQLGGFEDSWLATYQHPLLGQVTQPAVLSRFRRVPGAVPMHAPLLGEHTDEIMAEAGLDAARRAALYASGAVFGNQGR